MSFSDAREPLLGRYQNSQPQMNGGGDDDSDSGGEARRGLSHTDSLVKSSSPSQVRLANIVRSMTLGGELTEDQLPSLDGYSELDQSTELVLDLDRPGPSARTTPLSHSFHRRSQKSLISEIEVAEEATAPVAQSMPGYGRTPDLGMDSGSPGIQPNSLGADQSSALDTSMLSFFDNYDVVDGVLRMAIEIGDADLYFFKFSDNGHKMAVPGTLGWNLWICDLRFPYSAEHIYLGEDHAVSYCFQYGVDDSILTVGSSGLLHRWTRQEGGEWLRTLEYQCPMGSHGSATDYTFSNNGHSLAVASHLPQGVRVTLYDIRNMPDTCTEITKVEMVENPGLEFSMGDFSPSGSKFLMDFGYVQILLWAELPHRDQVFALPGGGGRWFGNEYIVTFDTDSPQSYLWKVESLMDLAERPGTLPNAMLIAEPDMICPGGIIAISGHRVFTLDTTDSGNPMVVWDSNTETVLAWVALKLDFPPGMPDFEHLFCMSEDGKWLATWEAGGFVTIWDAQSCVRIWRTQVEGLIGNGRLLFDSMGKKLIIAKSGGVEDFCHVYDFDRAQVQDELLFDVPDLYQYVIDCKLCSDGSKIGLLVIESSYIVTHVLIWNVNNNSVVDLAREVSCFDTFCFSLNGDKVATISWDGLIALWDTEGMIGKVDYTAVCNVKDLVFNKLDYFWGHGLCFTNDNTEIVLLAKPWSFVWIDMEGSLVHTAKVGTCLGHRFSADGRRCVILLHGFTTEVWDMVQRTRVQELDVVSPEFAKGFLNLRQQISLDGRHIVAGVDSQLQPWLLTDEGGFRQENVKMQTECSVRDYGHSSIVGPLGAISENGKYVATCVRTSESEFCVKVQNVVNGMVESFRDCKKLIFRDDRDFSGRLFMSPNGRRIAWVCNKTVRVWKPHADARCIPTYSGLKVANRAEDNSTVVELLNEHSLNLLTYPNGEGYTFIARVIEDRNTEWVKAILEWARRSRKQVMLLRERLGGLEEHEWTNLLELVINRRLPECIPLLLKASFDGTLVAPGEEETLCRALKRIILIYPTLFRQAFCDASMLHELDDEILYPECAFDGEPFLVCTHNQLTPKNVEQVWSKPVPLLVETRLLRLVRWIKFWRKPHKCSERCVKVPVGAFVVPVPSFAQVGKKGLLGGVLVKEMGPQVFSTLPMKCMIQFKWWSYGRELVYYELCMFVALLIFFSVFSILLGTGCRSDEGLSGGRYIASSLFLGLSMVLSARGLFGEVKQMLSFIKEARGTRSYWLHSKWNALEFTTYVLISIAIPVFYFGTDPCQSSWGISWAVPVGSILLWWKILYYAQAFRSTGPMVLMVFAIIGDIIFFLIIGSGVFFGFAVAFFVLLRDTNESNCGGEEEFGTLGETLLSTFVMMLGEFDLDFLHKSHAPGLATVFFVAYILVMAVILLNLLIAIMGDSFDRIKESEEDQFLMVRAAIIDDMESMLSRAEKRKLQAMIGRYLHVLIPRDRVEDVGEWQGRILELERKFRRMFDDCKVVQTEAVQSLRGDLRGAIAQVTADIEMRIDRRIETLALSRAQQDEAIHRRIAALQGLVGEKMDQLLARNMR